MSIFIAIAAVLVSASSAVASTARTATLEELVLRSELVILGQAGESSSYWDGGRIKTRTRFVVEEVWVGTGIEKGSEVQVVALGGVVGSIGQRVDGVVELRQGGRAVLCLARARAATKEAGLFRAVGMAQGAFHIDDTPERGEPTVRRSISQLRLVGRKAKDLPGTLSELKRAVLTAAANR